MKQAVIVKAKRTPIGKKGGNFKQVEPHILAAPIFKALAAGVENELDEAIMGNVVGPGGNIARLTVLEAGLPLSISGMTIDRQCSAGLEAIRTACYFIQGGAGRCYIAGGVESASTSPYPKRARFSPDRIGDPDMGEAAENVARKYKISRGMQDEYALLSYKRSWRAFRRGFYKQEIIGIEDIMTDECFYKERSMEVLLKRAKPIFAKAHGTVTAANSCGINDGAAAVLVMEETLANELNMQPMLRFIDSAASGVHPDFPGISPVPAIKELLRRNGLTVEDISLFEINEAFASKIAACAQELDIPYEKINVSGGALTTGHPYGASGAVLVTRLFYEGQRRNDAKLAVAAIGSAGGVGLAVLFEVIK